MKKTEQQNFECMMKHQAPGVSAFVARPCRGIGGDRSVVLIGNKTIGWWQGLKCWGGNHKERAEEYARRFNDREATP